MPIVAHQVTMAECTGSAQYRAQSLARDSGGPTLNFGLRDALHTSLKKYSLSLREIWLPNANVSPSKYSDLIIPKCSARMLDFLGKLFQETSPGLGFVVNL